MNIITAPNNPPATAKGMISYPFFPPYSNLQIKVDRKRDKPKILCLQRLDIQGKWNSLDSWNKLKTLFQQSEDDCKLYFP